MISIVILSIGIVALIVIIVLLGLALRQNPANIGDACTLHTDCQGYGAGSTDVACCEGRCTRKVPDWAGVGYCPSECKSGPAGVPGSDSGSCQMYHWPRFLNEPCANHTDCQGYGTGATDAACCKGKCVKKLPDWAGVGYCPDECTSGPAGVPGSEPGSCERNHWPRLAGEQCLNHTDCRGNGPNVNDTACCKGICTKKLADWAGVGYCPDVCVGRAGGAQGTCVVR